MKPLAWPASTPAKPGNALSITRLRSTNASALRLIWIPLVAASATPTGVFDWSGPRTVLPTAISVEPVLST